jgi:SlyX protein
MPQASPFDDRITELEIKASFTEDLLDKLDQVIIRQQAQIDALAREVISLRERATAQSDAQPRNLSDDLPPHY